MIYFLYIYGYIGYTHTHAYICMYGGRERWGGVARVKFVAQSSMIPPLWENFNTVFIFQIFLRRRNKRLHWDKRNESCTGLSTGAIPYPSSLEQKLINLSCRFPSLVNISGNKTNSRSQRFVSEKWQSRYGPKVHESLVLFSIFSITCLWNHGDIK